MSHYQEAERVFTAEIEGLQSVLESIAPTFDQAVELILGCKGKVVFTGLGKSGIIAHKIAATFASTGTSAIFMNASEGLHGDLGMVSEGDVVVMLSNGASTAELIKMLPTLKRSAASVIGIFGKSDTPLAKRCDLVIEATIEREACPLELAPMTSATVACVIGDALAAALIKAKGFKREDFAVFHPGGMLGRRLLLKVNDVMHSGANLPVVGLEASFREVVVEMTAHNLGGVCVCDGERQLIGFISDGDIRRHVLDADVLESATAQSMMTANPKTVLAEATLSEAMDLMETGERRIYILPVMQDEECVGIIRMHDIVSER